MLRILCPAKVNLFLAIQGKDETGYHLLDTVFMRTRLFQDTLTLERADEFSFECPTLPAEGNTVLKALDVLQEHTSRIFKYRIHLEKGIPPGSGLGGASSDAASLLLALNDLESLGLTHQQLLSLGVQVGMDVAFFLSGHAMAHGTHYGEILSPLPALPQDLELRIVLSSKASSTKEAFQEWDRSTQSNLSSKNSKDFILALKAQDSQKILASLHNDFQSLFPSLFAQSALVVQTQPGETAVLTGSGSALAILTKI